MSSHPEQKLLENDAIRRERRALRREVHKLREELTATHNLNKRLLKLFESTKQLSFQIENSLAYTDTDILLEVKPGFDVNEVENNFYQLMNNIIEFNELWDTEGATNE